MTYFVYMIHCSDGSYYIGSTSDLERRLTEHEQGLVEKSYTHSRRPIRLVWVQEFPTHEEAFAFEREIKGWSRAKKMALIKDDWDEIHSIVLNERLSRQNSKKSEGKSRKP